MLNVSALADEVCCDVIRYAIKGAPNQKLLLEDIYYAIESRVCDRAVGRIPPVAHCCVCSSRTFDRLLLDGRWVFVSDCGDAPSPAFASSMDVPDCHTSSASGDNASFVVAMCENPH